MKKIGIFVITVILMAVSIAAQAETKPGVYSLTPYVGYYKFEGNEGLKDTYTVGLRLGLDVTENVGMETFFSLTPTEIDVESGDNVRMWSYGIEGVYNFMPQSRLVPFVAVGIGGIYYDTLGFTDQTNKLAFDYGGGLKYFLNDNLALRFDVRHVIPISDNYNDFLFGFGLSYAFGQKKRSAAYAPEETYVPPPPAAPVAAPEPAPVVAAPVSAQAPAPAPVQVVVETPAPAPAVAAPAPAEAPVTVIVEEKEEKPAAEEDIKNLIKKWRDAWQSGDMQTYRSCYAPVFNVKGKDLNAWVAYKTKLQQRSKNIKISINDLKITLNDSEIATAVFTQTYSSSILKDSGEKILRLVKIDNEWKISDEIM